MDMQTTIELIALVVSAIGLGIYIGLNSRPKPKVAAI
jgi:hypothetical protein